MNQEWETYVRLRKDSDKLYKNGSSVWKEDPEGAKKLISFGVIIEENLLWRERDDFIILLEELLYGTLNPRDFSDIFRNRCFDEIGKKIRKLEIDLEKNDYKSGELLELIIVGEDYKDYRRKYSDILGEVEAVTEDFRVDPEVGSDEIGEE
jgi:hypothetical protein